LTAAVFAALPVFAASTVLLLAVTFAPPLATAVAFLVVLPVGAASIAVFGFFTPELASVVTLTAFPSFSSSSPLRAAFLVVPICHCFSPSWEMISAVRALFANDSFPMVGAAAKIRQEGVYVPIVGQQTAC
jgi:hypothetical protein